VTFLLQLLPDFFYLGAETLGDSPSLQGEALVLPPLSAHMRKPEKIKGLWFRLAASSPVFLGESTKFYQPGLALMQLQSKLGHTVFK